MCETFFYHWKLPQWRRHKFRALWARYSVRCLAFAARKLSKTFLLHFDQLHKELEALHFSNQFRVWLWDEAGALRLKEFSRDRRFRKRGPWALSYVCASCCFAARMGSGQRAMQDADANFFNIKRNKHYLLFFPAFLLLIQPLYWLLSFLRFFFFFCHFQLISLSRILKILLRQGNEK